MIISVFFFFLFLRISHNDCSFQSPDDGICVCGCSMGNFDVDCLTEYDTLSNCPGSNGSYLCQVFSNSTGNFSVCEVNCTNAMNTNDSQCFCGCTDPVDVDCITGNYTQIYGCPNDSFLCQANSTHSECVMNVTTNGSVLLNSTNNTTHSNTTSNCTQVQDGDNKCYCGCINPVDMDCINGNFNEIFGCPNSSYHCQANSTYSECVWGVSNGSVLLNSTNNTSGSNTTSYNCTLVQNDDSICYCGCTDPVDNDCINGYSVLFGCPNSSYHCQANSTYSECMLGSSNGSVVLNTTNLLNSTNSTSGSNTTSNNCTEAEGFGDMKCYCGCEPQDPDCGMIEDYDELYNCPGPYSTYTCVSNECKERISANTTSNDTTKIVLNCTDTKSGDGVCYCGCQPSDGDCSGNYTILRNCLGDLNDSVCVNNTCKKRRGYCTNKCDDYAARFGINIVDTPPPLEFPFLGVSYEEEECYVHLGSDNDKYCNLTHPCQLYPPSALNRSNLSNVRVDRFLSSPCCEKKLKKGNILKVVFLEGDYLFIPDCLFNASSLVVMKGEDRDKVVLNALDHHYTRSRLVIQDMTVFNDDCKDKCFLLANDTLFNNVKFVRRNNTFTSFIGMFDRMGMGMGMGMESDENDIEISIENCFFTDESYGFWLDYFNDEDAGRKFSIEGSSVDLSIGMMFRTHVVIKNTRFETAVIGARIHEIINVDVIGCSFSKCLVKELSSSEDDYYNITHGALTISDTSERLMVYNSKFFDNIADSLVLEGVDKCKTFIERNEFYENYGHSLNWIGSRGESDEVVQVRYNTFHGNHQTPISLSLKSDDSTGEEEEVNICFSLASDTKYVQFNVIESDFYDNVVTDGTGGAIRYMSFQLLNVYRSTFRRNTALFGFGGAIFVEKGSSVVQIVESVFERNSATSGGNVYLSDRVTDTKFYGNEFYYGQASNDGGDIYSSTLLAPLRIKKNQFVGGTAKRGGSIYGNSAVMIAYLNTFEDIQSGSCIYFQSNQFLMDAAPTYYGMINNSFVGCIGGAIILKDIEKGRDSTSLEFVVGHNDISNCSGTYGGGLSVSQSSHVIIYANRFHGNIASQYGGGVFIDYCSNIHFLLNEFSHNQAQLGGAVALRGSHEFYAGLAYDMNDPMGMMMMMGDEDLGEVEGGIMYKFFFRIFEFNNITGYDNVYIGETNTATWGNTGYVYDSDGSCIDDEGCVKTVLTIEGEPRLYSGPKIMEVLYWSSRDDLYQTKTYFPSTGVMRMVVSPGQDYRIGIQELDHLGNEVEYFPDEFIEISYTGYSLMKLSNKRTRVDGNGKEIVFKDLSWLRSPSDDNNFSPDDESKRRASEDGNRYSSSNSTKQVARIESAYLGRGIDIEIVFSKCPRGTYNDKNGHGVDVDGNPLINCLPCQDDHYSIYEDSKRCHMCPENAECLDPNEKPMVEEGYYGYLNISEGKVQTFYCGNQNCLGGRDNECAENFAGHLCARCEDNYNMWNGNCLICENASVYGIFLWIGLVLISTLITHVNSQGGESSIEKIWSFYGQTWTYTLKGVQIKALVFQPILDFLFSFKLPGLTVGSDDSNDFNKFFFSCPWNRGGYARILTNIFQPFVLLLLLFILFFIAMFCKWCCCGGIIGAKFSWFGMRKGFHFYEKYKGKEQEGEGEEETELEEEKDEDEKMKMKDSGSESEEEKKKKKKRKESGSESEDDDENERKEKEDPKRKVLFKKSGSDDESVEGSTEDEDEEEEEGGTKVVSEEESEDDDDTAKKRGTQTDEKGSSPKKDEEGDEEQEQEQDDEDAINNSKERRKKIVTKIAMCCPNLCFKKCIRPGHQTIFQVTSYLVTFFSIMVITYQLFLEGVINFQACEKIGENSYLRSSTDIKCYTSSYWFVWSIFFLIGVYCVLFPVLLLIFLCCGLRIFKFHEVKWFQRIFGPFFFSYKVKCSVYYESYLLLRRFLLVVFMTYSPLVGFSVGNYIISLILFVSIAIHILVWPYKKVRENVLELMSLVSLFLLQQLKSSTLFEDHESGSTVILFIIFVPVFSVLSYYKFRNILFFLVIFEKLINFFCCKVCDWEFNVRNFCCFIIPERGVKNKFIQTNEDQGFVDDDDEIYESVIVNQWRKIFTKIKGKIEEEEKSSQKEEEEESEDDEKDEGGKSDDKEKDEEEGKGKKVSEDDSDDSDDSQDTEESDVSFSGF